MSQSSHSGARQWRVDCDCVPEVAEERRIQPWERMHSEVSRSNASYFIEEDRLDEDLSEDDLLDRLKAADGTLVCCNVCGDLKEVSA